jgi:hypothetical protein
VIHDYALKMALNVFFNVFGFWVDAIGFRPLFGVNFNFMYNLDFHRFCFCFSMVQGSRLKGSEARTRISISDGPPNTPLVTAMASPSNASKARERERLRIMFSFVWFGLVWFGVPLLATETT